MRVRKYEVDTEKLKYVLKESKKNSSKTIKQISEALERPKTEVEHWFRSDNCFSIPSSEIWLGLKEILEINTDEFDVPITTFEIREGVFDQANRVYDVQGLSPTLTTSGEVKILVDKNLNYKGARFLKKNNLKLNKHIKVLSLFSGIGAFEKALHNLNVDVDLVGFSEIDQFAIEAYSTIHNVSKDLNLGDVSKVDINNIPDFDLMTYGFPCQDVSIGGKKNGLSEGSGTRSSLLWEAMKIAEVKKPKYMVAENVKGLIGSKFQEDFNKWITRLDNLGYNTYYKILNSNRFFIPQNRERIFVVSIRKDIDSGKFVFPDGHDCNYKLEDILEPVVDDKYFIGNLKDFESYNQDEVEKVQILYKDRILDAEKKKNYLQWDVSGKGYNSQQDRAFYKDGLCGTVPAANTGNKLNVYLGGLAVRRLTSKETWRLMGFTDEDHDKVKSRLNEVFYKGKDKSIPQLYKQAGNSIVVNVLEELLYNLLKN
ncbi:DNA (cytosine-5-)-methyltransferase [Heyndrickxia camelliae]|uniref:DNA (cytosine-5-)-methyltransferase n=1 Tax=Heyndrickxia camelliae TaxID=1707093 RepID=UPI0013FDF0AA|nr:DNA (cytosine-5-)-methyltransferase [Heyndrickxia camelliae]